MLSILLVWLMNWLIIINIFGNLHWVCRKCKQCREVWKKKRFDLKKKLHATWRGVHTEKSFRNLIESNQNQIAFTIFRLIWNQRDVRLVPNQFKNGKYNLISVDLTRIRSWFLCEQFQIDAGNPTRWNRNTCLVDLLFFT